MDRREFIGSGGRAAALATCGGLAWHALLAGPARAAAPLRPPGALAAPDFVATCVKCGQCVQACPYRTLALAAFGAPGVAGTPGFVPREVPCYMCEALPCVRACPTGALDPALADVTKARMGLAVIDRDSCLSWQGLRCEVCYRACPVRGKAITISTRPRELSRHAVFEPAVHADACTGCGVCEKKCPTEVAAIRVVDPALVQGRIGEHYRMGWRPAPEPTGDGAAAATGTHAAPGAPAAPAPRAPGALRYLNEAGAP